MALPTLVRTWQTNCNNAQLALGSALADNRGLLISIKNALLGFASNPWTVRYSCNSTTAGTAGDGVDRWGSTAANLVWNAAGSAHSWFVMQQSGVAAGFQVLWSLENSSPNGSVMSVVVSPSAGFTGGTTTARPTATDEIVVLAAAGVWGGAGTIDQSARWSVEQSTDGAGTRIIVCTAGATTTVALFEVPANVATGWSNPTAFSWLNSSGGLGGFQTYGSLKTRVGALAANLALACEGTAANVHGPADIAFGNLANEVSGEWPMWPIGVDCNTVGARGRLATLVDLWYGSSNVTSGDSYPATGTTGQFAQFGNLIIPWNNGPVNLT